MGNYSTREKIYLFVIQSVCPATGDQETENDPGNQ